MRWVAALLLLPLVAAAQTTVDDTVNTTDYIQCTDGLTVRNWLAACPTELGWDEVGSGGDPGATAYLAFSDIDDGPDTGIGDGLGSGAIVTAWGRFNCTGIDVVFVDSGGVEYSSLAAEVHVYYCGDADTTGDGGPANLYGSHRFQELAFSVPDSAQGAGSFYVVADGADSNYMPFLVRSGSIYHVASTGNDGNAGTFASPWQTMAGAMSNLQTSGEGSTLIYVHDVTTGSSSSAKGIVWAGSTLSGTIDAQSGIIAYPGNQPVFMGQIAFQTSRSTSGAGVPRAVVFSKMKAYASNYPSETAAGFPSGTVIDGGETRAIGTSSDGRVVGNYMSDIPGGCASKNNGGLQGNSRYADTVSNVKVFGNEIDNYGCKGSHQQHHTTYFSIRSGDDNEQLLAPEIGWNYLHDNWAKNGIHFFDQSLGSESTDNCGNFISTLKIHNNVVVRQGGAGININSSGCDTWAITGEIYNNVLVDVGRPTWWQTPDDPSSTKQPQPLGMGFGDNNGQNLIDVYNNIIYDWDEFGLSSSLNVGSVGFSGSGVNTSTLNLSLKDNIFITQYDAPYHGWSNTGRDGEANYCQNNIFYYTGTNPAYAIPPSYCSNHVAGDPKITRSGDYLVVGGTSAAIGQSSTTLTRDVYGRVRDSSVLGAVEDGL